MPDGSAGSAVAPKRAEVPTADIKHLLVRCNWCDGEKNGCASCDGRGAIVQSDRQSRKARVLTGSASSATTSKKTVTLIAGMSHLLVRCNFCNGAKCKHCDWRGSSVPEDYEQSDRTVLL